MKNSVLRYLIWLVDASLSDGLDVVTCAVVIGLVGVVGRSVVQMQSPRIASTQTLGHCLGGQSCVHAL